MTDYLDLKVADAHLMLQPVPLTDEARRAIHAVLEQVNTRRHEAERELDEAEATINRWGRDIDAAQEAMEQAGLRPHKHTLASAIEGLRRQRDEAKRQAAYADELREQYDREVLETTKRAERAEAWLAKVPEWTLVPDEPGPSDECLLCGRLAVDGHAPDCYWTKEGLREEGFGG